MMRNFSQSSSSIIGNCSKSFTVQAPGLRFYRIGHLLSFIPLSKATIWRKVKDGSFPRPVKLSARITAWQAEEIMEWLKQRVEG